MKKYIVKIEEIELQINYEYPTHDILQRDSKTGFTKKILSEIDNYQYE